MIPINSYTIGLTLGLFILFIALMYLVVWLLSKNDKTDLSEKELKNKTEKLK